MQDVLKILLQLRAEGTIGEFAIGGAIALQTGRAKDYQRVNTLLESGQVNADHLKKMVHDYALLERWSQYVRRYT